jgi:hypothetical protein
MVSSWSHSSMVRVVLTPALLNVESPEMLGYNQPCRNPPKKVNSLNAPD